MRRLRREAEHERPYLDDLLDQARRPLSALSGLSIQTIRQKTPAHDEAFEELWTIFSQLPTSGVSTCVGISKAVLLLTEGEIGPAFDSRVRGYLGIARPEMSREWIQTLEKISDDIAAFELAHGPLPEAVPERFAQLAYGRLYDMVLGPRQDPSTPQSFDQASGP
jgi:hypothetical protein